MTDVAFEQRIEAVRRFNRFYTRQIGVLNEGLLSSPFSLTQVRVLYELAHRDKPTASELVEALTLDAGYLSRILRGLRKSGLVAKESSKTDGRRSLLSLTEQGRLLFADLDRRATDEIRSLLRGLSAGEQGRLAGAMGTIEGLLGAKPAPGPAYLLRPHQPGDMGWIVHRHGVLYSQEYGWDEGFEALVASVVAGFIRNYDPKRERCWLAEMGGEIVGSVFLVRKTRTAAQLRLFLVEPKARGLGIGRRLVDECVKFARRTGYRKILLWTNDVLYAARHIYDKSGFRLVRKEEHHSFGHDLVGETWELKL